MKRLATLLATVDRAQFRREILIHGSLPLVALDRVIDEWIARVNSV